MKRQSENVLTADCARVQAYARVAADRLCRRLGKEDAAQCMWEFDNAASINDTVQAYLAVKRAEQNWS